MSLKNYFSPKHSRSREETINYKLFYELKIAAAKRGHDIQIYTPPVDQSGFDCVLDVGDNLRKVQIKTVSGNTPSWGIHAHLIKPHARFSEALGFEPTWAGSGYGGITLLLKLHITESDIKFDYYFFDAFILNLFRMGMIWRPMFKSAKASKLIRRLEQSRLKRKVSIPEGFFIKLKSADSFLTLAMNNNIPHYAYTIWEADLPKNRNEINKRKIECIKKEIVKELLTLTNDNFCKIS